MKINMDQNISNKVDAGIIYGFLSYIIWGFLTLYWKLLKEVPSEQILAHRILWSFIFMAAILIMTKKTDKIIPIIKDIKNIVLILCCSLFISINWFVYIWAVNSNHIIETSMGYYINPLVAILLGITVFKEKLDRWQLIAIVFAAAGVITMAVQYAKFPWIALILAITFAIYGMLKKMLKVDSMIGLTLETAVLTPFAIIYILMMEHNGIGVLSILSTDKLLILTCSGIATATPLLLFSMGAQRIPLSMIGFLQYISPTISLIIGVFIYGEPFTLTHMASFGLIWIAIIIYSLAQVNLSKEQSIQKKDIYCKQS